MSQAEGAYNHAHVSDGFWALGSSFCALGACVCRSVLKTLVSSPFWVFAYM